MRIVTDAGEEIIYEQLFEALLRRAAVETCYGKGERPTSVPCKACKLPLKVSRTGVIPWLCLYCKRRRNSAAYQQWYRRTYVERNLRLFGKKSTPTVRARAAAWYKAHRKEVLAKRAEACAARRAAAALRRLQQTDRRRRPPRQRNAGNLTCPSVHPSSPLTSVLAQCEHVRARREA
jgi:hypothetical protein